MIYDYPSKSDKIQQGDIFVNVPCVNFSFSELSVLGEDNIENISWKEIIRTKENNIAAVFGVSSVPAIVITQTCDSQRKEFITLCEIVGLEQINAFKTLDGKSSKNQVKELLIQNRKKSDFFYLPHDSQMEFATRKAILFSNTIRLKREELEGLIDNRKGRLKKVPYEHFREKLSNFFRRYSLNDEYMLNKDEIEHHPDYPDIVGFPWHQQ